MAMHLIRSRPGGFQLEVRSLNSSSLAIASRRFSCLAGRRAIPPHSTCGVVGVIVLGGGLPATVTGRCRTSAASAQRRGMDPLLRGWSAGCLASGLLASHACGFVQAR